MDRSLASYDKPLLNQGIPYVPDANRTDEDDYAKTYDAMAPNSVFRKRTHISAQQFSYIYNDTMRFFTEMERYAYKEYLRGIKPKEEFFKTCGEYLKKNFPKEMANDNDFNIMMERIDLAIFGLDVIQPLVDNPDTSDIKICSPTDIRVRVKGKAYKSNVYFQSEKDLYRFVEGLSWKNMVDIMGNAVQTFTDNHDKNYILRFTVSSPFVNAVDYPYLHIRKVPKSKPDFDELIKRKMLNEDLKLYLIDRAKASKGIVFAGPPGSGKSTALNAFIEYIPKTRETLVIQENDELHTEQSGFMFKHTTHGLNGEPVVTLEDLGKMALVEGCNEFIIGEVKGGEMRYAMTLLNAGGYAALTVHSTNAYETLDKMADLVKYGSSYSYEEARRMLKTFDTVVYMEGYKIREILEVAGYNDETHQYNYINIYRYDPSTEVAEEKKQMSFKELLAQKRANADANTSAGETTTEEA